LSNAACSLTGEKIGSTHPMTLIRKRTRLISFRVYDEEYARLMKLCISRGSASISDLARQSVYQLIEEPAELQQIKARVIELERQLQPFLTNSGAKAAKSRAMAAQVPGD
jgi:hypothetical protein